MGCKVCPEDEDLYLSVLLQDRLVECAVRGVNGELGRSDAGRGESSRRSEDGGTFYTTNSLLVPPMELSQFQSLGYSDVPRGRSSTHPRP